jgi:hypothetical protein
MRVPSFLAAFGLAAVAAGCSSGPEFAQVSGQITVKGKPAAKVRVEFHPDAVAGTAGPSSFAETDAEGRFTLAHPEGTGAVVGKHKVVLNDMRLAESETGAGIPIRFGPEYGVISTTPLAKEVKSGVQQIDIAVP